MSAAARSLVLTGPLLAAGLLFAPAPSRAIGALHTFQLSNSSALPPNPNQATATKSFLSTPGSGSGSSPLTLTFGNAKTGEVGPAASKLTSATGQGVCLYKIGRNNNCGVTTPDAGGVGSNKSGRANQTSIELSFNKDVQLISYQYGLLNLGNRSATPSRLVWTNNADSSATSTEDLNGKSANTVYTFASQFILKAFQTLTIAGFGGTNQRPQVRLSELVIREIPASSSSVPGPLPVLGAGAAYAWSRKLRSRIASVERG